MAQPLDPRDSIAPGIKEWEEFRASLAAALLHAWLLSEFDHVSPGYFRELEGRFADGFANAEIMVRDDPTYDGDVPVQWLKGGVTFFDKAFADELYDLLFPHRDAEGDYRFMAGGLAVVALQGAFEAFARSRNIDLSGGATTAVRKHILKTTGRDLDAATADLMTDCEATRHLFAHNRGIIDEAYIRRVPNCRRLVQDRREVDFDTVAEFARALRRAAVLIRDSKSQRTS
jgi:hypothetical protein